MDSERKWDTSVCTVCMVRHVKMHPYPTHKLRRCFTCSDRSSPGLRGIMEVCELVIIKIEYRPSVVYLQMRFFFCIKHIAKLNDELLPSLYDPVLVLPNGCPSVTSAVMSNLGMVMKYVINFVKWLCCDKMVGCCESKCVKFWLTLPPT